MRVHVQELTPGCGEWKAVLFDKYGQAMLYARSVESADKAEDALEDELRVCVSVAYGPSRRMEGASAAGSSGCQ